MEFKGKNNKVELNFSIKSLTAKNNHHPSFCWVISLRSQIFYSDLEP